jgi:glycosyltransferase involved in cell wall biosynthesis
VLITLHDAEAGGAGLSILRCAAMFDELGWRPAVWVPGPGRAADMAREFTDLVYVEHRPIRYSIRGLREPPGALRRLTSVPGYLRRFARVLRALDPTLVHANTLYCLPEATVARRAKVPVVLHVHEMIGAGLKQRAIARWTHGAADEIVTVSEAAARPLRRNAGPARIHVVHNGVGAAPGRPADAGGLVVGTVGVLSARKGTDLFLAMADIVAAARPDVRFVVLGADGSGPDAAFARHVRAWSRVLAARVNISIRESNDARAEMAGWSVFVLPARQDPFPLAVLEAMAAGLPVIATRVGGVPEQIEPGVSGLLVHPDDPRALAREVLRLVESPEERRRLGAAAADTVAERFTLARQAAELSGVYRRAGVGAVAG